MIFYLFLDGVGFGENNPDKNPFTKYSSGFFLPLGGKSLPENSKLNQGVYIKTDASMGIKGLPQSATGQTSLWTGINTPIILKRHVSGFPTFTLKKIIIEHSIIKVFGDHGKKAAFLNCYSPVYVDNMEKNSRYLSASTLIQLAASPHLKNLDDLREGRGLFMDITHEIFQEFSKSFLLESDSLRTIRDPFEMGKKVKEMGDGYDLILFEYFLTDKIGHSMEWDKAKWTINIVEKFIDGVLESLDPREDQLIITSDHGNLEDLSDKVHTTNPVPTYLYGKYTDSMKSKINSLCDIVPALYEEVGITIKPVYKTKEE
jgi:hypothetical protein